MATHISRQLPPGPEAVADARRAVDRLSNRLSEPDLLDLRLVVSELVTNSVRHGAGRHPGPVGLAVRVEEDCARVEVDDSGPGFRVPPEGARSREDSGWGLVLVDQLAEAWGVERNGRTTVWCELRLRRAGPRRQVARGRTERERPRPSSSEGTV